MQKNLQKIQEKVLKEQKLIYNFFDQKFSQSYYRFENDGFKAIWLKGSNNNLYEDYAYWPALRTKQLITKTKQFKLHMPGYGWIGFGTRDMQNDGFPGYTTQGWMLCTDGRVYHNRNEILRGGINYSNKKVIIKVDAQKSQISIDGIIQKMGNNIPKEVYFVISIYGQRTPYIQIQE